MIALPSGVKPFRTAEAAAHACGGRILAVLQQAHTAGRNASVAFSGGSTPKIMFAWMAQQSVDWSRTHIFFVDERAVPPDHEQSNYRMTHEALIQPAGIPPGNVHRIRAELGPEKAAHFYEAELTDFFGLCEVEIPRFDVIHLGMGSDAHTASLFPGEPLIGDRRGLTAGVFVPKLEAWRITLLPGVLLKASNVVVLATGADKAAALSSVFNGPPSPREYPMQVVARNRSNIEWFVDEYAVAE